MPTGRRALCDATWQRSLTTLAAPNWRRGWRRTSRTDRPTPPHRRSPAIKAKVHGNTRGLKASQRKALEKLAERRVKQDVIVTPELAHQLADVSRSVRRAVGITLDRRGRVGAVIVGDARRLYLPDLGRARGGGTRFRGQRLVRTQLSDTGLTHDDLTDLSRLQLDAVASVSVDDDGRAGAVAWAHLIPDNPQREVWRTHTAPHASHLDLSFAEFIRELEQEFEQAQKQTVATDEDAAMIVYVRTREDYLHEQNLAELYELCRTAGVTVQEAYVQSRQALDPRFAVGSGALEEVELRALQLGCDILIFGQDLSPAQMRGITERTNLRVIDRTQLILDIFAQRAQSRVGKLQVELAQLTYRLPRLSGRGTAMSRLGGGIGGRGPGETKLETDRRTARDRIAALKRDVVKLKTDRELRRKGRRERGVPVIALVGYTNAGKSTLLNTLTNSSVLSEDKLFATLDPTSRRLRFPEEREVVLTDTVGFIRDLPDELKEAFEATLEELADADLLLHVVDASDPAREEHVGSTERLLAQLGYDHIPRVLVLNKVDRLDAEARADVVHESDGIPVSALKRQATRPLIEWMDRWLVAHGHGDRVGRHLASSEPGDSR